MVHPDVRRMLMQMRAWNEGSRALVLWGSLQVDLLRRSQSEEDRQAADDLVSLLTPVIKGYVTDKGFEAAVLAQQVFGGHGYIREHGVEQFVRDARIAQIYEGTNGIQAMDLVGRKLPQGRRPRDPRLLRAARARDRRRQGAPADAGDTVAWSPRRWSRRSASCRRRPCGSPRTAWPTPTMPAPALTRTWS